MWGNDYHEQLAYLQFVRTHPELLYSKHELSSVASTNKRESYCLVLSVAPKPSTSTRSSVHPLLPGKSNCASLFEIHSPLVHALV